MGGVESKMLRGSLCYLSTFSRSFRLSQLKYNITPYDPISPLPSPYEENMGHKHGYRDR